MLTTGKLVIFGALGIAVVDSGCLYHREVVREPVPVAQATQRPAPPPDEDLPPPPSAQSDQDLPPPGADVADEQVFYEPLSPYGHWEWVPEYGRVWVPAVAPGWRPYVYGRWVFTDWGWTWVSNDPWAWAAYHYGSWGFTVGIGWFWVPGHIWAPAWVTWRWGFGFCAWAPIGPRGFVFGVAHPAWVAVRAEHFTRPISVHVLAVQQTRSIVERAAPLSGPRATPARGGSFGPPVAQVASAIGHRIEAVSARSVVGPRPWARAPQTIAGSNGASRAASSPMQSPRVQTPAPQAPRGQPARSQGGGAWRRNWSQDRAGGTARAPGSSGSAGRGWAGAGAGARSWGAPAPARSAPAASGGPAAASGAPAASSGGRVAASGRSAGTSGGAARSAPARGGGAPSAAPGGSGGRGSGSGAHAHGRR